MNRRDFFTYSISTTELGHYPDHSCPNLRICFCKYRQRVKDHRRDDLSLISNRGISSESGMVNSSVYAKVAINGFAKIRSAVRCRVFCRLAYLNWYVGKAIPPFL